MKYNHCWQMFCREPASSVCNMEIRLNLRRQSCRQKSLFDILVCGVMMWLPSRSRLNPRAEYSNGHSDSLWKAQGFSVYLADPETFSSPEKNCLQNLEVLMMCLVAT